jgi:hypothetical protein
MLASSLALIIIGGGTADEGGGPAHTCGNTTLPVLGGVDFVASWNNAAEHDPVIGSSSFVDTELGGYKFWFASAANLAIFRANRSKYVPKYGGY